MNANLSLLHPYPFEKLAALKQGIVPVSDKSHIALSIGEPKHATPGFIQKALIQHLHGLSLYPSTKGLPELRSAIAQWLSLRFAIPIETLDPENQILPVNGTREALFSLVQTVINADQKPLVLMPNPFYQIYEGATLLAGAEPYYYNTCFENGYLPNFEQIPEEVWRRCQLLFICSPGNPTGTVLNQACHQKLLLLAEHYDFVIASDECYTELYDNEDIPPQGLLQSCYQLGYSDFRRCIIFQSLSKRSNVPGLRSGFVAGDKQIMLAFLKYRTYHGCAMPIPTQYASILAWQDELHVISNRQLYRDKFNVFIETLQNVIPVYRPEAGFYIWLKTPKSMSDTEFARQLFIKQNLTVLPGSYLSRVHNGINPGANHVRIALVAPIEECHEAAKRISAFVDSLY